jgi:predicted HTH transcriptional regulator
VIVTRQKLIERAQTATSESKYIDFKAEFDTNSTEAWCEVIKDIIAMANSGGGIVVFGVENTGASNPKMDHATLLAYDTADITNKIAKYTNYQFADIEVVEVQRGGKVHGAFLMSAAEDGVCTRNDVFSAWQQK